MRALCSVKDEFIKNFQLFSGKHFLAVNKPPDFYLERSEHRECVEDLVRDLCNIDKFRICGQLDYATSGVLLIAKSKLASKYANILICSKIIHKVYLALLYGHLPMDTYHITRNICNPKGDEFKMRLAGSKEEGKPCYSVLRPRSYHLLQGYPVTLCELRTVTGRRHQLRLHCTAIGHPIVGDVTYFNERNILGRYKEIDIDRMMLHCWILARNRDSELLNSKYLKVWPEIKEVIDEIEVIVSPDSISKYVNNPPLKYADSLLVGLHIDHDQHVDFENQIDHDQI